MVHAPNGAATTLLDLLPTELPALADWILLQGTDVSADGKTIVGDGNLDEIRTDSIVRLD